MIRARTKLFLYTCHRHAQVVDCICVTRRYGPAGAPIFLCAACHCASVVELVIPTSQLTEGREFESL